MTAPDPRVGEIEARLSVATPGPWVEWHENGTPGQLEAYNCPPATGAFLIDYGADWDQKQKDATFIAHTPADVAYLLAELRKAREALTRVEGFLDNDEDKLYAAICRNTCGKDIYGVDHEAIATTIATDLRAAVAAAKGDGR